MTPRRVGPSEPHRPTPLTLRRWLPGLFIGSAYFALVALIMSSVTGESFLLTMTLVAVAALAVFACGLVVAVRWALAGQGRQWQIQLGSLFLLTAIVGVYFAVARWILVATNIPLDQLGVGQWLGIVVYSVAIVLTSLPFVLIFGDAVLALAAWFVWRPSVQHTLHGWRTRAS